MVRKMIKYADNSIVSNPGNPIHIIYAPEVQDDGTIKLVESGKENTDEYIDSFREECDISTIIKKYQNGDISVLKQREGMFGDFTNLPKTYAEMLQLRIDSERAFNSLPLEVKQKFNNDEMQFFASAGSNEWLEKCGIITKEEIKESEDVKE